MNSHSVPQWRIGEGHDVHRLAEGRKFIVGGIEIPHTVGPIGHSDADVLLHAVTDALLGAIAAGDIGELFPDTDEQNKDVDSAVFLTAALNIVQDRGYRVSNLDCTIFAQSPKLSPYKQSIRERLAELLGISSDVVNVKAKTGEQVGPIGRKEAIGASASVLLMLE